jgi:hypothetical protein
MRGQELQSTIGHHACPSVAKNDQMRGKKSFPNHVLRDEMLAVGSSHR